MAKTVVTLPNLKKSGIVGIKEMRDTVGHVIDAAQGEALVEGFFGIATILYQRLYSAIAPHSPSIGNKQFPPGTLLKGLFITRGKVTKPNVLVGIGGRGGANYLAIWLEHGTVRQQAQPFFRPAVLASKPEMAPLIANVIKDALEQATQ